MWISYRYTEEIYIYLQMEATCIPNQVIRLEEVESTMTLQYTLLLEWRDTRVTFRNLRQETFLNTMGKEDALKVWYPKVVFYNTEDMAETKVR